MGKGSACPDGSAKTSKELLLISGFSAFQGEGRLREQRSSSHFCFLGCEEGLCSTLRGADGCLGPCLHPPMLSPLPLPTPSSASAPSAAPGPACSIENESEKDLSCRERSLLQPSSVPTALQSQHSQHQIQQSLCQPWASPGSSSSSHQDVVLQIPSSQRNSS